MKNKRLEIYLGWTCNKKCIFCSEYNIMEKNWNKKIHNKHILFKLIKYKKEGYNHVTFLGGEPFIQKNFLFALKTAKKLGYKILVTTNAATLQFEQQAQKYLPFIDELILSIHSIDNNINKQISKNGTNINYDLVFQNITKYWTGSLLKINTIISPYNLDEIFNILDYLKDKNINEISLTYPDLYDGYYSNEHKKNSILVKYGELFNYLDLYYKKSLQNDTHFKIIDVPFCCLPYEKLYKLSDDYGYENRVKIVRKSRELNRDNISPRNRTHIDKCTKCAYNNICWGVSKEYIKIFGDAEINPIK